MRQVPRPGRRSGSTRPGVLVLVLVALLLSACTGTGDEADPSPSPVSTASPSPSQGSPTPGRLRVAVVISPEPPLRATTADIGVRALDRALGEVDFRVVTADDAGFLADVASFLTTEGHDLVCVVGPGAAQAVAVVARSAPSTRFCAAPARPDGLPGNVLPIDIRTDQATYVVARAAQAADPGTAVGLLTGGVTWLPARLEAAIVRAVRDAGTETPIVLRSDVADEEEVADQVARLVEASAVTLISAAGVLDRAVLEAAQAQPLPVDEPQDDGTPTEGAVPSPSPTAPPDPVLPTVIGGPDLRPVQDGASLADEVMAIMEVHAEVAVEVAVRRLLDGWSTDAASVGLGDGGVVVVAADTPRGRQVGDLVERLVQRLVDGEIELPAAPG